LKVIIDDKRWENYIFEMLREKCNFWLRIVYQAKLSFKDESKIKILSD
jgi:3-phenylpropionate/cinnamic acid dioxygenase small subunit